MADKTKEEFDDKGMIRVFVYGTLKKDHGNHVLIQASGGEFLGYDSITGAYKMCDMGGFPGVYHPGDGAMQKRIYGELWALQPEGLATLDMLEGHPNFYRREKLWTNDVEKKAWMYFLSPRYISQRPELRKPVRNIDSGIWGASNAEKEHWGEANAD